MLPHRSLRKQLLCCSCRCYFNHHSGDADRVRDLDEMEFRGKKLAEMVSLLPMVMPSMILAVFFSAMLLELGLTDPYVNIVCSFAIALYYAIRILSAGFKAIPQDLIILVLIWAQVSLVHTSAFLPMLKPSLLASSIFCLVISIEEFSMSYVLGAPDFFITVPTILYSFWVTHLSDACC